MVSGKPFSCHNIHTVGINTQFFCARIYKYHLYICMLHYAVEFAYYVFNANMMPSMLPNMG